jgi:putative DNA primase/helicase
LRSILGDYAGQILIEALMTTRISGAGPTPEIADLKGCRFVTSSETEHGQRLAQAKLKYLTGMGKIKGRRLYENSIQFAPTFKLFIDCNHKPLVRGADPALWDRLKLIPFNVRLSDDEVDKNLLKKLEEERPGILKWAVDGCLACQREGLGEPEAVRGAVNEYQRESDLVGQFLDETIIDDPEGKIPASHLYDLYRTFCNNIGEPYESLASFGRTMTEKGYRRSRDSRTRRITYVGANFRDENYNHFTESQIKEFLKDSEAQAKRR